VSRDVYDYRDAAGGYLFSVVVERRPDGTKRVLQGVRNGDGFVWSLNGIAEPPLYRLPELAEHLGRGRREPVYVVEGEKDAEALRECGLTATTNPMGAGKWRPWHTETLTGARHVIVLADADEPGRAHARQVAAALRHIVERVELLEPPAGLGEHADVADLLAAGRDLAELVPLTPEADVPAAEPSGITVESLDTFADTVEEGAEAILGTAENALIPENGDVMMYGDGGAGKTTLAVDLALHLAAGDDWLGIAVPRPLRVLLIENEGPRPRFRVKLRRKRDAWAGSPMGDRIHVLAEPWARFTFAGKDGEGWRAFLAAQASALEIEVVICGPLTSAGMDAAGTLQDVRNFLTLVKDVRRRCGRQLVVILVHHENKGGKVSGAWEGAGDTLLHVQAQGRGRVRLHVQKARWASEQHGTTLHLLWAEGEGFAVEEQPELTDDDLAERILAEIDAGPGTAWGPVEKAIKGVGKDRLRPIRDGMLAAGKIVNLRVRKREPAQLLDHVEEAKPSSLYRADDPTITQLRRGPAAVPPQSAALWGDGTTSSAAETPRPEGASSRRSAVHPPADPTTEGGQP